MHVLLSGLFATTLSGCDRSEPLQAKNEYAALQTAEFEGRSLVLREPVIRVAHGMTVLGVPGEEGKNVWVLLRANSEPYYKQLPEHVRYSVSEDLVRRLEKEGRVSPEVARWLRKGGV